MKYQRFSPSGLKILESSFFTNFQINLILHVHPVNCLKCNQSWIVDGRNWTANQSVDCRNWTTNQSVDCKKLNSQSWIVDCRNWTTNQSVDCRNWTANQSVDCRNCTANQSVDCRNWTANQSVDYRNWTAYHENKGEISHWSESSSVIQKRVSTQWIQRDWRYSIHEFSAQVANI